MSEKRYVRRLAQSLVSTDARCHSFFTPFITLQCSNVLSALNAANQGTHALENAANTVSGIIGDLDTTIMFASSGTLNAEEGDDSFAGKLLYCIYYHDSYHE